MQVALAEDQDSTIIQNIRSQINDGISLPFHSIPPPLSYANTYSVQQHISAVRSRLKEYISIGAVVPLPCSSMQRQRVQPLHVIIKPGKKPRLVIDLSRNLNQYLHHEHFSYSSIEDAVALSTPGCWYGKLDLSNCFLSFPLHPDVRQFFVFELDGQLYQFNRMPFGLSTAPRVCTQLLSVIAHELTQNGARFVRYLDDFLFVASSREQLTSILLAAQSTFAAFGLVVNPDKTEGPLQRISFLGIQLDSLACTLSCTTERVAELTALLRQLRNTRTIRRRDLESVIGKLSFAAQVLPGARPFMRHLLDMVHSCKTRSTPVRTTPCFRADIRHWLIHLSSWNGRQQWRAPAPFVFASDASLDGFGFYLESVPAHVDSSSLRTALRVGTGYTGSYASVHSDHHASHTGITWCELLAVYAAAHTYAPQLRNQSVLFLVDNSTDVAIINRQATRSSRLSPLLRSLYDLSLRYNFSIRAQHRPGVHNELADFLSRPLLHRGQHVTQWAHSYPSRASDLLSVIRVHSQQFVNADSYSSSLSSAVSHFVSTRARRIRRRTNSSSSSAAPAV
jgi:Reverse transcriptase (RNA-dependent DNA polymerase)